MPELNVSDPSVVRPRLLARAKDLRQEIEAASAESAQAADESEVGDARLERHRDDLIRVLAALQRIADGSYGSCLDCGQPIDPPRLAALPAAERCVACQSHRERDGEDGFLVLDAAHRNTLIHLDELMTMVESIADKGLTAQARVRAGKLLAYFGTASRRHHEDEERHIFPPLLASGKPELVQNVLRLQQDHFWLEEDWRELEPQLSVIADGVGSYNLDELRAGVEVMVALHRDHIALEESLIYPQARGRLGLRARREMGREMSQRRRATG